MTDALQAGRELDALVAEKAMGWRDVQVRPIANAMGQHVMDDYTGLAPGGPTPFALVPRYSVMIQEAWRVVEKLRAESQFVAVISGSAGPVPQPWVCKINREGRFLEERGDTAALAICLAAVKASAPPA